MESTACDLAALEAVLDSARGRPLLVHHFATWCEPCEAELPILGAALARVRARAPAVPSVAGAGGSCALLAVAVAWDLFLTPVAPAEAIRACEAFLARLDAPFDRLVVYTGQPPALFASQRITQGTVPFTDVRGRDGRVLATFDAPLDEAAAAGPFTEALLRAAGA